MSISFLADLIADARTVLDDPAISASFSDATILRMAGMSFRRAFRDINIVSSRRVVLPFDVAITTSATIYELPPVIGEIVNWGRWNTTEFRYDWVQPGSSRRSLWRPGIFLEGMNRIRLDKAFSEAFTLRVEYIPGPHAVPHQGKIVLDAGVTYKAPTSMTFPVVNTAQVSATTVPYGELIRRKNGFVGQVLKIWPNAGEQVIQERVVTAQVAAEPTEQELTVDLAWDDTPAGAETWHYEVLPWAFEGFRQVVMLGTTITLCAAAGLRQKRQDLLDEYMLAARTEKLWEAYYSDQSWETDTREAVLRGLR